MANAAHQTDWIPCVFPLTLFLSYFHPSFFFVLCRSCTFDSLALIYYYLSSLLIFSIFMYFLLSFFLLLVPSADFSFYSPLPVFPSFQPFLFLSFFDSFQKHLGDLPPESNVFRMIYQASGLAMIGILKHLGIRIIGDLPAVFSLTNVGNYGDARFWNSLSVAWLSDLLQMSSAV